MNNEFYFMTATFGTNIIYEKINATLQIMGANIRLGPALDGNGEYHHTPDIGLMGIYMKEEDLNPAIQALRQTKRVTLEEALEMQEQAWLKNPPGTEAAKNI